MTDEEFKKLLQELRKPKSTSEGERAKNKRTYDNHHKGSHRSNFMFTNTPTPKTTSKHLNDNTYFIMIHMYDYTTGKKQSIDALLKPNPKIWGTALSNELGQLTQGIRDIDGNNVMDFIPHYEVPRDCIVIYSNMVCDIRPLKTGKN